MEIESDQEKKGGESDLWVDFIHMIQENISESEFSGHFQNKHSSYHSEYIYINYMRFDLFCQEIQTITKDYWENQVVVTPSENDWL